MFAPGHVPAAYSSVLSAWSEGATVDGNTAPYGEATFAENGLVFSRRTGGGGGGRGVNIAAFAPGTAELIRPVTNFDTYGVDGAWDAMIAFIDDLPNGSLMLIAIADEAAISVDYPPALRGVIALEAQGSQLIRSYLFRNSWAMACYKGQGVALDEKLGAGVRVTVQTTVTISSPVLPAMYPVTGRVTSGGVGVPGVTVLVGDRTGVTNASGRYVVAGLLAGNYAVAPLSAGYAYAPTSSLVTLPSSGGDINFVTSRINNAPVAANLTITTPEDTTALVTLAAVDADGDPLAFAVQSMPDHGDLSGAAPALSYVPDPNFHGSDHFTFTASDGTAVSNTASVTITVTAVNDAPQAVSQTVTTAEDTARSITLAASDVDGDALTYTVLAAPTHGSLSGSPPSVTYTPAANYQGGDSFTFRASDGTVNSNTATVSITVSPANDPPTAAAGPDREVSATGLNTPVQLDGSGSTDVDGDPLDFVWREAGTQVGIGPTPSIPLSVGPHTLTLTVRDESGATSTDTVSVNVTVPASSGRKLTASGAIHVAGMPARFTLQASRNRRGRLTGKLKFTDPQTRAVVKSITVTTLVVEGSRARVFGTARVGTAAAVPFYAEAADLGPRVTDDQFKLELGGGQTYGPAPLVSGKVKVTQ
jgi:hypothetical protein